MSESIKQMSLNNSFVVFGLPVFSNKLDDFTSKLETIKYRLETIQFRSFNRANNFQFMSYKSFLIKDKPDNLHKPVVLKKQTDGFQHTPYFNDRGRRKKEIVFRIKPDIQNDIYHLFVNDIDEQTHVYYNVAYIPDFTTSVMMNKLFRNIKENQNLDALEESDDEEEFENEREDRFVNLDKCYNMVCLYNYKFKKWYPIKIADTNMKIVTQNELSTF